VGIAPADAATKWQVGTKIVNLAGQACDNVAGILWRNKGAIGVTAGAVAIATQPEVFVSGATSLASQTVSSPIGGTILLYLTVAGLLYAGWRFFLRRVGKRWGLPLLALGLLLFGGGSAMAGTIDIPASDVATGAIKPMWDALTWIIVIIAAIFL
jgi:hypothetical protein